MAKSKKCGGKCGLQMMSAKWGGEGVMIEKVALVCAIVVCAYFAISGYPLITLSIAIAFLLSRWQARCALTGKCPILHSVVWIIFALGLMMHVFAHRGMKMFVNQLDII